MHAQTLALIQHYYDAFNRQDMVAFLSTLADDVVHDINQGGREIGKQAFASFMQRMNAHYREQIVDLSVTTSAGGERAAAEFRVLGEYLKTDAGLPDAAGQRYALAAGAFFSIRDQQITRVSNYYNLNEWVRQVGG